MLTQTLQNTETFDPTVWVDRYGDYLYAFAFSRIRDESAAEDLVQETLLAAIEAHDSYQQKSSERTWLTGILRHKIIDYFRRASREELPANAESSVPVEDHLFWQEGPWKGHWTNEAGPVAWEYDPEQVLEYAEFRGILIRCLNELPKRAANAFTLREIEGFRAEEICAILGISLSNFWVIMHRARLHLRRCLDFNWFRKEKM